MVDQITSKQEGFGYFNVEPGKVWLTIQILILMKRYVCVLGMSVALVVNNLGGTSNLELLLVMNEAISYLGQWVELNTRISDYMGVIMKDMWVWLAIGARRCIYVCMYAYICMCVCM